MLLRGFGPLLLLALCSCSKIDELRDNLHAATPHERYAQSLRESGLAETIIGRAWVAEGERVSRTAPLITLPFREAGFFRENEVRALAARFMARRGEAITATLTMAGAPAKTRIFLDLFALPEASDSAQAGEVAPPRRVASADTGSTHLVFESPRTGTYLLRVQPELLGGGRYVLSIERGPSLAFPVSGRDSRAVLSYFGAERDGGRRDHQGVDIFARRGTAVTAAAPGVITNTGETRLGGKVVWLRDTRRGQSLYYAHLDSQIVRAGQSVGIGDTLGLVGNTGNARTTDPHLHFGIYRRGEGAVDPYPFIQRAPGPAPTIVADTTALGNIARVRASGGAVVRASPDEHGVRLAALARETLVTVDGAAGHWYRVGLPGDSTVRGFVLANDLEAAVRPLRSTRLTAGAYLRSAPTPAAWPVDTVGAGTSCQCSVARRRRRSCSCVKPTAAWPGCDRAPSPRAAALAARPDLRALPRLCEDAFRLRWAKLGRVDAYGGTGRVHRSNGAIPRPRHRIHRRFHGALILVPATAGAERDRDARYQHEFAGHMALLGTVSPRHRKERRRGDDLAL